MLEAVISEIICKLIFSNFCMTRHIEESHENLGNKIFFPVLLQCLEVKVNYVSQGFMKEFDCGFVHCDLVTFPLDPVFIVLNVVQHIQI